MRIYLLICSWACLHTSALGLPLISSFQASPSEVDPGEAVTISWTLNQGVTSLTLEPGIGSIPARSGSGILAPQEATVYTLTASDGIDTESRSVTIEVSVFGPIRLNEIQARNAGPIQDEDGDESDWIELRNLGGLGGNLAGWYLTDDPENLSKWEIPNAQVNGNGYLMIFASGKDRIGAAGELHANFGLAREGEYLALVEPDGLTIHHEFSPEYPEQNVGVSWGLSGNGPGYFVNPTPLAANTATAAGSLTDEEVVADITRGFFAAPFNVALSTEAVGAEIYYTTDASEPSPDDGILYTAPISISTTTTLRASAFFPGTVPLKVMTHTYLFLDDVVNQPSNPAGYPTTWQPSVTADYSMASGGSIGTTAQIKAALRGLPTLSLVMEVDDWFNSNTDPTIGGIYSNSVIARGPAWERRVSAEFFDFPHGDEIQLDAGMRIFGNASRTTSRKKHNMRLVFRSSYGESTLKFPIFGEGSEDDEVNSYLLRGQNGDSWFHPSAPQREEALYIRDQLARRLQGEMGQPATRQGHIHVYLNGMYWGLFNTIERIESDSMVQAFGGEKEDWDVIKSSPRPGIEAVDGSVDPWDQVLAISETNMALPENYDGIQEYLDLENMIDWLLVNFYNGNSDWDTNNWQAGRLRGEGETFKFFTWDSERTLLGPTVNNTTKNNAGRATGVHQKLRANADYRLLFADRVHRHFFNSGALTPPSVAATFQGFVDELRTPLIAESARWGDAQRAGNPYTVNSEWQTEVNYQLSTYIPGRTATVLNQFRNQNLYPSVEAPVMSQFGGNVTPGFNLTMTAPAGEIRYTIDGSDPKDGGGFVYSGAVPLGASFIVNARVLSGGEWSALSSAAFYVGTESASSENLVISELYYHPLNAETEEEFVELMNVGDLPVDLRGVEFRDGVEFSFDEGTSTRLWVLVPGERILLVKDLDDFAAAYPAVVDKVVGTFSGSLNNDGEWIDLRAADGSVIHDFAFNDAAPWPKGADGAGHSLTLILPDTNPDHRDSSNWRVSMLAGGTPGSGATLAFGGLSGVDSDGDELDDFFEYAIGTDAGDRRDGRLAILLSDDGGELQLQFPVRVGADQARLMVESSTNLEDWESDDSLTMVSRAVPVDGRELMTFGRPVEAGAKRFYRLKVAER